MRMEDPKLSQENVLQLAVKCVNDTTGPEGLVHTLLVFDSLLRPARNIPVETQLRRARIVENSRKELEVYCAAKGVGWPQVQRTLWSANI
jgi:hypothetical protein